MLNGRKAWSSDALLIPEFKDLRVFPDKYLKILLLSDNRLASTSESNSSSTLDGQNFLNLV